MFNRFTRDEVDQLLDVAGLSLEQIVGDAEDKAETMEGAARAKGELADELEQRAKTARQEVLDVSNKAKKLRRLISKAK